MGAMTSTLLDMDGWNYALIGLCTALAGWVWWRSTVRAAEIRQLAKVHGFHYLGKTLPYSVPLGDLPVGSIMSVWNVIDGESRGRRVVAFDCRFGEGKGSWQRTILAVHDDNVSVSSFDSGVQVEQVGDWTFLYRPKQLALIAQQLTPVAELGAYLETI
jgi:hypothetical protein